MESEPAAAAGDPRRDLVVIGASAGGVEALREVVAALPSDLDAAICVVLHVAPGSPSALAGILRRAGQLPCHPAANGESLTRGQIMVAPPDHHLVIEDEHVRLTVGPRENNHRPAVDVLFRSAAHARGRRVIGIVLSGTRDDGTAGLASIKQHGGAAIVQDPADALYPGMPASALEHVAADAVVPSRLIGRAIEAMVNGADPPSGSEARKNETDPPDSQPVTTICPECGGVLREEVEAGLRHWQCRVGHRYSPDTLIDAQADDVEAALWTAVRALSDRSILLRRMADRAQASDQARTARSFRRRATQAEEQADLVRRALTNAAQGTLRRVVEEDDAAASEGGVA